MSYLLTYLTVGFAYIMTTIWYFGREPKSRGLPKLSKDKYLSEQLVECLFSSLMFAVLTLFWPVVTTFHIRDILKKLPEAEPFSVKSKDLINQLTIEQIEKDEMVYDPLEAVSRLPFGFLNDAWLDFASNIQPTWTIWSFSTVDDSKIYPKIKKGYAILCNDNVIQNIFISESFHQKN
ncbi:hypothetical protein [Colwellia sp. MEBiC06753]